MPTLLLELKKLCYERSEASPFQNHTAFLKWADQVEPLLYFHPEFLQSFKHSVHAAKMVHGSRHDNARGVNEAIGTVNKAITMLETQAVVGQETPMTDTAPAKIEYPPKLTMKWLYEHAPWSFYAWLLGSLSAAFVLGFSASEALTKMNNANLSVAAPTTTKLTTASPLTTSEKPASSVIAAPQK